MAIKPIEEMTSPVSRGEETQMAMSDAPEDYLKRAVEQFIIEFPEFEDLQGQELYDKMYDKGYFSDRYAMSEPQGVMQLASSSGLDIQASSPGELQLKIDALNWAMKTLGRNSWAEVLEDSDMQGVLNAYQDAGGMD